jgi:hypothetical protein
MSEIIDEERIQALQARAISAPLVEHIYIADPSAHVFEDRIYVYSSHDIESGIPFNDNGDHFAMEDYHVISLDGPDGEAVDHGVALHVDDVTWAARQMWAPDAACKDGKYYLYFPAKRPDGIFQIGVAIGDHPAGPFVPEPEPIEGSYSIDPAVFEDDGAFYLYFGGIWGGQLQKYRDNVYDNGFDEPAPDQEALAPRVARLSADMKQFIEAPRPVQVIDEHGDTLLAGDHARRYFEAPWVHRHGGKYYFSYSTGNTHLLCYAVGDSPYGPFTYRGRIMTPVIGWTTHHSICEFEGRSYLFYHDSSLSDGVTHLRSVKVTELHYDENGDIVTVAPYGDA